MLHTHTSSIALFILMPVVLIGLFLVTDILVNLIQCYRFKHRIEEGNNESK
jgi:hypothetical protein